MEVILLERIERLGQMGDVVTVKPGFARNYLLPQKKAMRATEENRNRFSEQRAQLEAANLELRAEAEGVRDRMVGINVTLVRQAGDAGQLYGSVSSRDIAEAVTEAGATITRQQIPLAHPIKAVGIHEVRVVLHPEVTTTVSVNVARSAEEAEQQAKTGRAVLGFEEEEEAAPIEEIAAEVFEEGAAEEAIELVHEAEAEEIAEGTEEADEGDK